MANRCKGFIVSARERPSGSPFWLASGTLNGRQIKREFSGRHEAMAYAEARNSEMRGVPAGQSPVLTHLPADAVREAENVIANLRRAHPEAALTDAYEFFHQVAPALAGANPGRFAAALHRLREKFPDVDPARVCDWFTENYRPPASSVTLQVALENYLADVLRRRTTGSLSSAQFDSVGFATAQLEKYFGQDRPIAELTTPVLQDYLRETTLGRDGSRTFSNKTWNNRRGYLTSFFEYCVSENWLDVNPATRIKNYKKNDLAHGSIVTLTAAEATALMEFLEDFQGGRMVPFFAICLFCGVRPDWQKGEISRLRPEQVDLAAGRIHFRETQTKTKKPRVTQLQPNVVDWLRAYPLEEFPILAVNFKKLYLKLRKDFALAHDVLRHTYCSMLVGKFRSVGDAALQAGNTEGVVWAKYLNLVPESEAEAFWEIRPKRRRAEEPPIAPAAVPSDI